VNATGALRKECKKNPGTEPGLGLNRGLLLCETRVKV
jgi:hypothetical protein